MDSERGVTDSANRLWLKPDAVIDAQGRTLHFGTARECDRVGLCANLTHYETPLNDRHLCPICSGTRLAPEHFGHPGPIWDGRL